MSDDITGADDKTPRHFLESCELLRFVDSATKPSVEFIDVSPAEARHVLLHRNEANRNLRSNRASDYARDVQAKAWPVNGETVKFCTRGLFLDGQHRFHAVASLENEVSEDFRVRFLVVAGLDPGVRDTIDHGIPRTHADVLRYHNRRNPPTLAAITRKAMDWERGDRRFKSSARITPAEMLKFLEEHPELERSVQVAMMVNQTFKPIPKSIVGVAHYLFNKKDPDTTVWFFQRLADGADLKVGHPVHTLRHHLYNDQERALRKNQDRYMVLLIRTWNGVRKGRQMFKISDYSRTSTVPDLE